MDYLVSEITERILTSTTWQQQFVSVLTRQGWVCVPPAGTEQTTRSADKPKVMSAARRGRGGSDE